MLMWCISTVHCPPLRSSVHECVSPVLCPSHPSMPEMHKWCFVYSLVFHLIHLCVKQTWHHRNPTCPWQNVVNPQWLCASQGLPHTHSWHSKHLANCPLSSSPLILPLRVAVCLCWYYMDWSTPPHPRLQVSAVSFWLRFLSFSFLFYMVSFSCHGGDWEKTWPSGFCEAVSPNITPSLYHI